MGSLTQLQQIGLASAGTGVAGAATTGVGQYESGQETKAAYDYNAAVTLQTMRQGVQTTETKYDNLTGRQASLYAAAGVAIDSGSPLLMMAHTAGQKGEEEQSEETSGNEQAALQRYYGQIAAFSGTTNGINSFFQGLGKSAISAGTLFK